MKKINRRKFIKSSALIGASTALYSSKLFDSKNSDKKLRLGIIGTGLRGQWMTHLCLLRNDVEIKAITAKAKGTKCPVCWKINEGPCPRHP